MSKNFGCDSCGLRTFGKRRNSQAAKAMRIMRSKGISLKEAWKIVKGGKRHSRRRSRRHSRRRSRRHSRRISRRRSRRSRRRSRRSRRFGIVAGPGFKAQTSYPNSYAPYFGASEPFLSASEYWYPQANGKIQSPQMLMTKPLAGYSGPSN